MATEVATIMNVNSDKKEMIADCPHISIIKYLNYQRIKVNNDLLNEIKNICENENENAQLQNAEITSYQLTQIKKLKCILKDIPSLQKEDNLYMYYIFIILNLTPNMVKNLTRLVIANIFLKYQVKTCYNYLDIMKRNNYLDDLIEILQDLHLQKQIYLEIFVETLHIFFT